MDRFVSTAVVQALHPAGTRTEPPPVHKYFWLAVVLIFAGGLRLLVIRFSPHLVWPDEIFQVQEPAHRLVYGTGITAWEFVLGIRSWLLPGIVAGLMTLAKLHGDDPLTSTLLVTLFMTLCSLAPVLCAYLWGYRFGGLGGAVIGGGFAAVWIDLVYFSTHPLTEVIAGQSLAVALYLGYPGDRVASERRLFWAGVMFGLTFAFRFHLAPALGVAVAWIGGLDLRRRWLPLLGGALVPVLLLGILDAATLGLPFQSVWLNTWINLVHGVSEDWGTAPWYMAIAYQLSLWGSASVLIAVAALFGATRLPLLLAVAATVGVVYAAVPHKEYRFVYPALPLLAVLVGIGTARVAAWRPRQPASPLALFPDALLALAFWSAVSATMAVTPSYRALFSNSQGTLAAFRAIASDPAACGVGLLELAWPQTPGATYLPTSVPIYEPRHASFAADAAAFNRLVTLSGTRVPDQSFTRTGCFDDVRVRPLYRRPAICVWARPGRCVPGAAPAPTVNWPRSLEGTAFSPRSPNAPRPNSTQP